MNATHAFVGYRRCGGAMFIGVDDPNEVPFTRGEVVALLRAGGRLEGADLATSALYSDTFAEK